MKKSFIEIQNDAIVKYRVKIVKNSPCWGRVHAHVKTRKICKWKQCSSFKSTFLLLHEIGHIETTKTSMRRAESEYHATVWAIDRCAEYKIPIQSKTIDAYQNYIDEEIRRGERRGGKNYGSLDLYEHIKANDIKVVERKRMTDDEITARYFKRWANYLAGVLKETKYFIHNCDDEYYKILYQNVLDAVEAALAECGEWCILPPMDDEPVKDDVPEEHEFSLIDRAIGYYEETSYQMFDKLENNFGKFDPNRVFLDVYYAVANAHDRI